MAIVTNYIDRGIDLGSKYVPFDFVREHYPELLAKYKNQQVQVSGVNSGGQLGLNHRGAVNTLESNSFISDVKQIEFHQVTTTHLLKYDGTVWVTGIDTFGTAGLNNRLTRSTFTQMGTDTTWVSISASHNTFMGIKSNGTLWGCGSNANGQLGINNVLNRSTFTQVGTKTDWRSVSVGANCVVAIDNSNNAYTWGAAFNGGLGQGNMIHRSTPVQIAGSGWVSAVMGRNTGYLALIKNDGTLWTCGDNANGQLGLGDTISRSTLTQVGTKTDWKTADIFMSTLYALDESGQLYGCGQNTYNLLLEEGNNSKSTLVQLDVGRQYRTISAGGYIFTGITRDGQIIAWGDNTYAIPGVSINVPTQLAEGNNHVYVKASNRLILISDSVFS